MKKKLQFLCTKCCCRSTSLTILIQRKKNLKFIVTKMLVMIFQTHSPLILYRVENADAMFDKVVIIIFFQRQALQCFAGLFFSLLFVRMIQNYCVREGRLKCIKNFRFLFILSARNDDAFLPKIYIFAQSKNHFECFLFV